MTDTDKLAFRDEMRRAAIAFHHTIDDAQLAVYWEGLRDLDLDTLRPAFRDCIEQLKFFPRVADLRDAEVGVRAREYGAKMKALIAKAPDPTEYHCTACRDTGFVRDLDCPGDGRCHVAHCGQPGHISYAHEYTRKCHCRATNPVLIKPREERRVNATKEKAGARS